MLQYLNNLYVGDVRMSNRVSKALRMLEILGTGRKYKKEDLANMLATNPRNINEYKNDLEEAGYRIETKNGKNGGYILDTKYNMPMLDFTEAEKTALIRSNEYLKKTDFILKNDFNNAILKLESQMSGHELKSEYVLADTRPVDFDLVQVFYKTISAAIERSRMISMDYHSIKSGLKQVVVHPYELVLSNGFWYLLGRDNIDRNENNKIKIKMYKLSSKRMSNLKILEDKPFLMDEDYNVKNYIGTKAVIKSERVEIELEARGVTAISLSEKIVGINPSYEWKDNDTLLLKTTIEGAASALNFVMSLGCNATLLKPQYLIDEVEKNVQEMMEMYK